MNNDILNIILVKTEDYYPAPLRMKLKKRMIKFIFYLLTLYIFVFIFNLFALNINLFSSSEIFVAHDNYSLCVQEETTIIEQCLSGIMFNTTCNTLNRSADQFCFQSHFSQLDIVESTPFVLFTSDIGRLFVLFITLNIFILISEYYLLISRLYKCLFTLSQSTDQHGHVQSSNTEQNSNNEDGEPFISPGEYYAIILTSNGLCADFENLILVASVNMNAPVSPPTSTMLTNHSEQQNTMEQSAQSNSLNTAPFKSRLKFMSIEFIWVGLSFFILILLLTLCFIRGNRGVSTLYPDLYVNVFISFIFILLIDQIRNIIWISILWYVVVVRWNSRIPGLQDYNIEYIAQWDLAPSYAEDFQNAICDFLELELVNKCFLVLVLFYSLFILIQITTVQYWEHIPSIVQISSLIDFICLLIFSLEIVLKMLGYGIFTYIGNIWNFVDFVVVVISLVFALVHQNTTGIGLLRLLRLIRIVLVFRKVQKTRSKIDRLKTKIFLNSNADKIKTLLRIIARQEYFFQSLGDDIYWLYHKIDTQTLYDHKFKNQSQINHNIHTLSNAHMDRIKQITGNPDIYDEENNNLFFGIQDLYLFKIHLNFSPHCDFLIKEFVFNWNKDLISKRIFDHHQSTFSLNSPLFLSITSLSLYSNSNNPSSSTSNGPRGTVSDRKSQMNQMNASSLRNTSMRATSIAAGGGGSSSARKGSIAKNVSVVESDVILKTIYDLFQCGMSKPDVAQIDRWLSEHVLKGSFLSFDALVFVDYITMVLDNDNAENSTNSSTSLMANTNADQSTASFFESNNLQTIPKVFIPLVFRRCVFLEKSPHSNELVLIHRENGGEQNTTTTKQQQQHTDTFSLSISAAHILMVKNPLSMSVVFLFLKIIKVFNILTLLPIDANCLIELIYRSPTIRCNKEAVVLLLNTLHSLFYIVYIILISTGSNITASSSADSTSDANNRSTMSNGSKTVFSRITRKASTMKMSTNAAKTSSGLEAADQAMISAIGQYVTTREAALEFLGIFLLPIAYFYYRPKPSFVFFDVNDFLTLKNLEKSPDANHVNMSISAFFTEFFSLNLSSQLGESSTVVIHDYIVSILSDYNIGDQDPFNLLYRTRKSLSRRRKLKRSGDDQMQDSLELSEEYINLILTIDDMVELLPDFHSIRPISKLIASSDGPSKTNEIVLINSSEKTNYFEIMRIIFDVSLVSWTCHPPNGDSTVPSLYGYCANAMIRSWLSLYEYDSILFPNHNPTLYGIDEIKFLKTSSDSTNDTNDGYIQWEYPNVYSIELSFINSIVMPYMLLLVENICDGLLHTYIVNGVECTKKTIINRSNGD